MSSVWDSCFLLIDNPRGGVEDLASMKAAGFEGVFCNVRDYPAAEWTVIRSRAQAQGMFCGPWGRTSLPNTSTWDPSVLDLLVSVGDAWQAPLLVNSEKELDGTLALLTSQIAAKVGTRDAAVSMEAFLFHDTDWTPIGHLPMLLQIFPVESAAAKDPAGCKRWAHSRGCRCVYFTFGTYGGMKPGDFDLKAPYSLFTADAAGSAYSLWSPTSSGFQACEEETVSTPWYRSPYKKGTAVGPAHLPRELKPPSSGQTMTGDDVTAMKRAISHAQRWLPWAPSQWDKTYGERFAMGKGTGTVGDTGLRGFQRQEGLPQTGIVDDVTYQRIRRALIPVGAREGAHILDALSIGLIKEATQEFTPAGKLVKLRAEISNFCERAEANEDVWHYTQKRPFGGLGVPPERNHENDCSGYVILAYHWARQKTGILTPDPSGYRYSGYGNTWDDLDGHSKVTTGNYLVGDLAHYDGHVTICRKEGNSSSSIWSSFGQESGPEMQELHYRPDLRFVVRPPLLPA